MTATEEQRAASSPVTKWVIVGVAVVLTAVLWRYRHELTLEALAEHEATLRREIVEHPARSLGLAFAMYVLVTGLSVPGAAVMTLAIGWFFGLLTGVVLVSFASTLGATLAMVLCRTLLRDAVARRLGPRLAGFDAAIQRDGAFYLFSIRLTPAIPFVVVNALAGLTQLRLWTFWWVSQLGMLPGTVMYVLAGASAPSLQTLAERGVCGVLSGPVIAAFIALGLFPLLMKKGMDAWHGHRNRTLPS